MKKGFLIFPLILLSLLSQAQVIQDTTVTENEKIVLQHSPKKAAIYSAILPGAGQFYNKKYWKIPVVYAGLGVGAYSISFNTGEYKFFREQYLISIDTLPETSVDPLISFMTSSIIKANRDSYRRNVEISYIVSGLWYVLNILDATVDAHLFNFDVGEDLSMRIEPFYGRAYGRQTYNGLGVKLYFK